MKQGKRTKSAAAPVIAPAADTAVSAQHELPDAAYVDQLLAASAPASLPSAAPVAVAANALDDATTVVVEALMEEDFITLPEQCLMRDAVEFKQRSLLGLQADAMTIDVGAVERIDTAFMQVLTALVRSRPETSAPITWLNVNAVFAEAAQLLGLQPVLAIPAVSAAA